MNLFEMDADFSHNPNDLLRLYNACKNDGADVAVGSRYVKGGGFINWPANRILLSAAAPGTKAYHMVARERPDSGVLTKQKS